jgi:hypothetical protein
VSHLASPYIDRRRVTRLCAVWLVVALLLPALPAAAQPAPTREIRLRIDTPAYTLEGGQLAVAGDSSLDAPGAPRLPMWGQLVELPDGVEWSLTYTTTGEQVIPLSAALAAVPVAGGDLNGPYGAFAEDVPDTVPTVDRPDPAIYGQDAFYPASLVQAGPEGVRRGQRLLPVRVFPFQYNPVRGELRYYPQIEVVISLQEPPFDRLRAGSERSSADSVGGTQSKDAEGSSLSSGAGSASRDGLRIRTGERGLYRLTYDDLNAAGVPLATANPAAFAVSYLNQPVDIEIVGGEDGKFDPGDLVIFYAEPYAGRYQNHNDYRFTWDDPDPRRIQVRAVTPAPVAAPVSVITQTLHVEFDRVYYSTYHLPRDADHIFDNPLYVNAASQITTTQRSYILALDDLVTSGNALIRAQVHGGADAESAPDQSLKLAVNGHDLGTYKWDGSVRNIIRVVAPSAWLAGAPGQLTLTASLAQLPTLGEYWVSPDWVEVSYPATAEAEGDRLYIEGQAPPRPLAPAAHRFYLPMLNRSGGTQPPVTQRTVARGFASSDVRAYNVADVRRPVKLTGAAVTNDAGSFTVRFIDAARTQPTYFLSTAAGLLSPLAIEPDAGSDLRTPGHPADYIAIVHRSLWDAVQPLLDHRAAEGMTVAKVDVQDIYDEWSGGRLDPEAIRAFLSYAYHNWNAGGAPPTYVLLVGDGHYDFRGVLKPGLPMLIPPYLLDIDPIIGETAADNRFVSVDGPEDFLADMEIGRIPAKTPADVTAAVDKILAYEAAAGGDWQQRAVFVADDKYDGNGFHDLSEAARLSLPALYQTPTIYYRQDAATDTPAEMRAAIRAAFDQGALYLQWFGHASPHTWSKANVFDTLEPPKFQQNAAAAWPFTVSYACWSGYFIKINPSSNYTEQTIAEVLLLTPGRGSVADFSPTGLHVGMALQKLNEGVVKALFQDRIDRAGAVVAAAKEYYFSQSGWALDVLDTQVLFGDPATRFRLP